MASGFLLVAGTIFLLGVALPLFFAPLTWARWFRWTVPADQALTIYLGRSLGAAGIAVVVVAVRAAGDPVAHREVFDLLALLGILLAMVHVWGAIQRIQPWIETAEIAVYVVLTAASIWLRSTL